MVDHSASYNGLDLGAGTDYKITSLVWWRRATALNTPILPRYHGGIVGASFEAPRQVELDLLVRGSSQSDLVSKLDALYEAFQPQVESEPEFTWTAPGQTARSVFCRPLEDDGNPLTVEDLASGSKKVSFRLLASDPAIYGAESQITLSPQALAEGLDYPVTYPKQYGAAGTLGVEFDNTGDWETWPVFQIEGPDSGTLTNPSIVAPGLGKTLALTANGGASITAGQTLEISTHPRNRYIRFLTGASRYGKLSADSEFFALPPGTTELRFQASGDTTGASVLVTARPAWI